jgi:hypothetical protein
MINLRFVAGKLLLLPLGIGNFLLLAAGLAGAMTWSFAELVDLGSSDPWKGFLVSLMVFSRMVTVTFIVFGGLAWFIRRKKSVILSARLDVRAENARSWFFGVITVLIVHGFLAILFLLQVLPLFHENIAILEGWGVWGGLRRGGDYSGIFLVPVFGIFLLTGLAFMTALTFVAGVLAFLGNLLLGPEDHSRILLRSIWLQAASILGLFFTLTFLESGVQVVTEHFVGPDTLEFKANILHWLNKEQVVFAPMAKHFALLLPGFIVCEAVVLWKSNEQKSMDAEAPTQLSAEKPMAEPNTIELSNVFVETDERFRHEEYLVKYRFFSNPLYKVFDIYDSNNEPAFTARMNGLSLFKRSIRVYSTDKEGAETLTISGRRLLRFPNSFDITCCPKSRKVGIFKKSPVGWSIADEYGRNIASLKLEESSWGSFKGQIMAGHLSVCKYIFQNPIRPIITISFRDDPTIVFDRKLGIGLALVLGFQAVAFNQPYSDVSSYSN